MGDRFRLISQLEESHLLQLHALFQRQWWSEGRSVEGVRIMANHSSALFALVEQGTDRLVAFCRVVTDFAFRGMLHDVIVDDDFQGQGIGRRLMEAVIQDPRLADVDVIGLWCRPELVPLYEKFGFEPANQAYCWMQRAGKRTGEVPA